MANKVPHSIADQIALLKQRGMLLNDEPSAHHFLENISYYRLKGYWWDMQDDYTLHTLKPNTCFEDIIDRYTFDRHLRLILFDAIERIEIASMGSLSKLYKNLKHQLPEKATIANEMGLNLHSELSSWLEAITYVRNIIAHHSRLWSRNMVKVPIANLNNPLSVWLDKPLSPVQTKKPLTVWQLSMVNGQLSMSELVADRT